MNATQTGNAEEMSELRFVIENRETWLSLDAAGIVLTTRSFCRSRRMRGGRGTEELAFWRAERLRAETVASHSKTAGSGFGRMCRKNARSPDFMCLTNIHISFEADAHNRS
jgi:hypothetical protein